MNPLKALGALVVSAWSGATAAVKATLSLTNPSGWVGFLASSLGLVEASYVRLARLAAESPYGSRGLRLIADNAAALPLVVMKREDEDEVASHDGKELDVLRRHWGEIVDTGVWGLFCGGRFYVEKFAPVTGPNAGRPRELRAWRPDELIDVVRDEVTGEPREYVFRGYKGRRMGVEAERVLAIRTFDPFAMRMEESGMPILLGARRALSSAQAADDWNRSLSASGGRLEGFMMPTDPAARTTSKQTAEAQESLDARMGESKRRGTWHVLGSAYKPVPTGMSPKDADFLKKLLSDMEATACVLGVSPQLLAHPKSGSLTDAGVDSEVRALLILTVLPFVRRRILDALSRWLLPEGARFDADEAEIKALQEDEDARWKRYGAAYSEHRVASLEEVREKLNLPPDIDESHTFRTDPAPVAPPASASPPVDPPEPGTPPVPPEAGETAKALGSLEVDVFGRLLDLIPKAA
ncbi:MAG: hypothetical protein CMM85_06075 [Rhodothermaceae bacterium]|nr:hypothetical protein [Rhodothermaceae bacterium]